MKIRVRQADEYWVHAVPARSDITEARLLVNEAAKEIFERLKVWPTHIGFGKMADGKVKDFFFREGAKPLPKLVVPFGEVWLAYGSEGGWLPEEWNDMPRWLKRPSDKPELARHIGSKRKHPKSTRTKQYRKPTKRKAKKDKAEYKNWEGSVVRRTKANRPNVDLRTGKQADKWYGFISKDFVMGDVVGVAGEHVLRSIGESGLVHYYAIDEFNQRHEVPASCVVSYSKASAELAEQASKPVESRIPDMNKILAAINKQAQGDPSRVIEIE